MRWHASLAAAVLVCACATAPPQPAADIEIDRPAPPIERETEAVIDAMTVAWNAHDAERYAAFLHPEVVVQTIDADAGEPTGRKAMAEASAEFFAREPDARIEIVSRLTDGRFVIERERMVGLSSGTVFWTTVIYEVRDGLVTRMWIVPRPESAEAD